MDNRIGRYRAAAASIALAALIGIAIASFLPLIETNVWWIRFLDYPRLQFALVTLVLMAFYVALRQRPGRLGLVGIIAAMAALGYQAYKLHPYSWIVKPSVMSQSICPDGQVVRVMAANVKKRNESAEAFLAQVSANKPDLLLVMETDAWWDERLTVLGERFRHQIQSIPEDNAFYGMHLFSRLELISPEFRFFFGADTPTAVTRVRLPDGDIIGFMGLHPKPPLGWSQPTTIRDAHLLKSALLAREWAASTILAGDFNAVPWERITRRTMRIGELLDPRVGRGLFPSFDAESNLISWPLDQILVQPQFALLEFRTLPEFGSDHLAVLAILCHETTAVQRAPSLLADDLAEAESSIAAARKLQ